jgi:hypothetical protein
VSTDDEYDIQLLRYLIERLLLSREVAFPVAPDLQGKLDPAVIKMNVVGYARSRDEIEKGP